MKTSSSMYAAPNMGVMALINHVPKRSHTLSFHSKIQINSGEIQINWVKLE